MADPAPADPIHLVESAVIAPATIRTMWVAAVLLAMVAALWIPFGVHGTPQADGWILKDRVASGDRWFFSENPTRVFLLVPWTLADLITPESFVGIHLLLIVLMWGKALTLFEIVRRLPGSNDGFAFLTSALSIVYPASTTLFSRDEVVDRHWAVLFLLLAILILQVGWRRLRWRWVTLMWAMQVLSLWTNEAVLPLALAVPLLMLWANGWRDRNSRRNVLLWLIIPTVNALHNLIHHLAVAMSLTGTGARSRAMTVLAVEDGLSPMFESLVVAYRRHLFDGWQHSVGALDGDPWLVLMAGAMAICTISAGYFLWPKNRPLDRRLLLFLVAAGIVIIGLGFAPFVPTQLRFSSGRSFIISSLGAMLLVPSLVAMVGRRSRWSRWINAGLVGILVFFAASNALRQHARYNRGAKIQDRILAAIIEQAPRVREHSFCAVMITGNPHGLRRVSGIHRRSNILRHALRYLYDEQRISGGLVDSKWFTAVNDHYQLTPQGVTGHLASGHPLPLIGYEKVLLFRVNRNLDVKLLRFLPPNLRDPELSTYRPRNLVDEDAALPPRWRIVGSAEEQKRSTGQGATARPE